jgi:hypothetical protein
VDYGNLVDVGIPSRVFSASQFAPALRNRKCVLSEDEALVPDKIVQRTVGGGAPGLQSFGRSTKRTKSEAGSAAVKVQSGASEYSKFHTV